jgi:molybdopterin converting factor small subunit
MKKKYKRLLQIHTSTLAQLREANEKIDTRNLHIKALNDTIETLERYMKQQNKSIERKDAQFLGLRMAFQDEIINKML